MEKIRRNSASFASYNYQALRDEIKTSRFFDLLPGNFEDEIQVHLFQMTLDKILPPTIEEFPPDPTLDDIAETVGPEWEVLESLDGQFLFRHRETNVTSWMHPEAHIARETYTRKSGRIPNYEAISYTWGSMDNVVTIQVDTYEQGEKKYWSLLIPENLEVLLKHIRFTDRKRTLWADSISINQKNLAERNAHVKRMAQVYGFASRVIVWLGPSSDNSKLAISNLDLYATQIEYTVNWQRHASPHARYENWHLDANEIPFEPEVWQAISDLLDREWFKRLWILQEIQLANDNSVIRCGPDHIDWPRFRKAVLCLRDTPGVPSALLFNRLINLHRVVVPVKKVDFLRLLSRAQQQNCLDQKDKIYGVLSLAGPQIQNLIQPDYAKSVQSVYRDAFEAIVKHTERLEILSYCVAKEDGLRDLPSWVPDWTVFVRAPVGHLVTYGTANLAAGHTRAYVNFVSDTVLQVAGVRAAKIEKVQEKVPKNRAECFEAIKEWMPAKEAYPTGENSLDAFVLTLITGFVSERFGRSPVVPGHVIPTEQQTQAVLEFLDQDALPVEIPDDVKEVLLKTQDRMFFETEDGYYGVAAGRAKAGDYVCTILGCDHLMILRPSESGAFRIVGPCYAHGLWDGEPILGRLSPPWTMKLVKDDTGIEVPCWFNSETTQPTFDDPRLADLPSPWRRVIRKRMMEDSLTFEEFQNVDTGEVIKHDPRVSIEALRKRNVSVEMLVLM